MAPANAHNLGVDLAIRHCKATGSNDQYSGIFSPIMARTATPKWLSPQDHEQDMHPAQISFQCQRHCTSILRVWILGATCLLAACGDEDIRAYRVPKDSGTQTVRASAPPPSSTSPTVTWTLPTGWVQVPGERSMRIATFRAGPDESAPEVSLSAFPGDAGGLLPNINRWRGQIGLKDIDDTALAAMVDSTMVDGVSVSIVNMLGSDDLRMLGAVIDPGDGQTWFVKATDAPDRIEAIVESFAVFARSFHLEDAIASSPPHQGAASPEVGLPERLSQWSPPPHWQRDPDASPILSAAFLATNDVGGARITLTSLRGSGGGTLANINRWRGQLGLAPVATLTQQPTLDLGGDALIVDLISDDQSSRMVAAILPSTESVWYFKMTGSVTGIAAEREIFESFVRVVGLGEDSSSPNAADTPSEQESEP